MKQSLLFAGAMAALLLTTTVRSQEPAMAVEPLLQVAAPADEPTAEPPVTEAEVAQQRAEATVKAPPAVVTEAEAARLAEAEAAQQRAEAAVKAPPAVVTEAEAARLAEAEAAQQRAEAAVKVPPAPPVPPAEAIAAQPEVVAVEDEPEGIATQPAELTVIEDSETPTVPVVVELADAPHTELTVTPDGTISVNLEDAPISEVVKLFSQLSGANIIAATSNLNGTVTVNLKNVAWQPAFEAILSRHELILNEKPIGSGIYIVESGRLGEESLMTQTIQLKYAKTERIAELINTMLRNTGKATPFADGNVVLVQAPASKLSEIRTVVDALDKARGQVYIEARFVEMSAAASKKLGLKWDSLSEWGMGVKGIEGGIEWNRGQAARYSTGTFVTDANNAATPVQLVPEKIGDMDAPGAGRTAEDMMWRMARGLSGRLAADDFRIALSAFENEEGVSMISNPKIIVANEETATVDMTTKEPYIEVNFQPATTDNGRDTVSTRLATIPGKNESFVGEAFFSYGVSLKVTPRVSSSGVISIKIEPSISELTGYYAIQGTENMPSTKYPVINMKKIETTFSMLDGSTAVIGGLTRSGENNIDSGIPLLRKIPWIGPRLFGWKGRQKEQTEIIIFVTVGIVDAEQVMAEMIGLPKNAVLTREIKEPGDLPREAIMRLKP